jgi:hypothetical protein
MFTVTFPLVRLHLNSVVTIRVRADSFGDTVKRGLMKKLLFRQAFNASEIL